MKAERLCGSWRRWLLGVSLVLVAAAPDFAFSQPSQPVITSIRPDRTNVVVTVDVPRGVYRVTLESRERFGAGAWVPVAVLQVDGAGGTVTFRQPCTRRLELLRVKAGTSQPLPAGFYRGTNEFAGMPSGSLTSPTAGGFGGVVTTDANGTTGGLPTDSTRAVVESDIWRVEGDRLYFFNQYRGLQVIEIGVPDAARVLGTLSLPAAGEQMYLAGTNHVVLLSRGGCGGGSSDSQVLVVEVSTGVPQVVKTLPIAGTIQESRMVGTALYVVSQVWRAEPSSGGNTWEWGSLVSAFDLADPGVPVSRGTLWYGGYGNVVAATDTLLFVATQDPTNWWQSVVQMVDITSANGAMAPFGSVRTAGRVNDKFKLNYASQVLTAISEDWHGVTSTLVTKLETFRVPDPRSGTPVGILKLGELELGHGEQLHATRFDGDRVYVVTFFRVDPLWIVDLSDPAKPHMAGSLDVPGWSTYILPLGGRLVSVGVETNRVAVSLFDVRDPAQPGLFSRVLLGENHSWSEANNDEKAFTVLTDIGLILVPYNGDTTNGWTSRVQLIDLLPEKLVARGTIDHKCVPRRTAYSHDRVLSLSGWELLSVDVANRDEPVVRGETELAWPVDRVFVQGDFVVEIAAGANWWMGQSTPTVRVAAGAAPDVVLGTLPLGSLPVVGADARDGRLYLVQGPPSGYLGPLGGGGFGGEENFVLMVVDVSKLPELKIVGQVSRKVDLPIWGANWEAVWPKPDVVVWAGGNVNYWWWGPWLGVTDGVALRGDLGSLAWPIGGFGGGQLLAFEVSSASAPEFRSEINLTTNGWWGFSQPFLSGSLVYLSHNASEKAVSPVDSWVERYYLDVIDYMDPSVPAVRKPVVIPGTLHGVTDEGELLYTVGFHWSTNSAIAWKQWLDASAYDGVGVHPVASLELPPVWPHPVRVIGENVLVGRPGFDYTTTNVVPHRLEAWRVAASGNFEVVGKVELNVPASVLFDRGGLLAVQGWDSSISLFKSAVLPEFVSVGGGAAPGCVGFDLTRSDGVVDHGWWLSLGVYGVQKIPTGP